MTKAKKIVSRCESCVNYVFDEDCECYCCMVDLDEDEAYRSMSDSEYSCPYYMLAQGVACFLCDPACFPLGKMI